MGIVTSNFDFVVSVFQFKSEPSYERLFIPSNPFKWDESFFLNEERFNNNLNIPTLWDPSTSYIPESFFQSGYGFGDNIKLSGIKQEKKLSISRWTPKLLHGSFFSRRVPFYLYSDESITQIAGLDQTEDGRTLVSLWFPPKPGVPISVQSLKLDHDFNVALDTVFQHVSKFTGKVVNGTELDADLNPANIDTSVREFKVNYNPNNIVLNWRIPAPLGPGEVTFTLPEKPLVGSDCPYKLEFSRKDIFVTEKYYAAKYNDGTYGGFTYGTGVENTGDYMINAADKEITVILDQQYLDLGFVSFVFDYPATIELNNNYIVDFDSDNVDPSLEDLKGMVRGPQSDGLPNQSVPIGTFPIVDDTTERFLDEDNFHLFLFDSFNSSIDKDWVRVLNFDNSGPEDKHYVLDSEAGFVLFGDGEKGVIPQVFKFFYFGLKTSLRVEYEPINSTDYWTDRTRDIHPLHNSLSSGFLYLSRKELVPVSLIIDFPVSEITALESAELRVTLLDRGFEPVPNKRVDLEVVGGVGSLEDSFIITNENGQGFTNYLPSSRISDTGIVHHFFEEGANEDTPGAATDTFSSTVVENDTITLNEEVSSDISDIFLFKIYANTDEVQPYNHVTRTGGAYIVYFKDVAGTNELIRPIQAVDNVLRFEESLPQPFDSEAPNYEPNLRGYAIITKRKISVQGSLEFRSNILTSNIETLLVRYSDIQQGDWTLPIPPTTFTSSEIDRAIFVTIN